MRRRSLCELSVPLRKGRPLQVKKGLRAKVRLVRATLSEVERHESEVQASVSTASPGQATSPCKQMSNSPDRHTISQLSHSMVAKEHSQAINSVDPMTIVSRDVKHGACLEDVYMCDFHSCSIRFALSQDNLAKHYYSDIITHF